MSMYLKYLSFVSHNMARFIALELPLQSLTKKDLVKCLKAKMTKLEGANLKGAYFNESELQAVEVNKSL